uniref:Uncharacterized protein n=1 Tax=Physcomitrium patens TaxID=3218 RepID=A0A2K1KAE6_PHYPA|nr:hypothetical protein PHYPA_009938 [Physcomitrium patens]
MNLCCASVNSFIGVSVHTSSVDFFASLGSPLVVSIVCSIPCFSPLKFLPSFFCILDLGSYMYKFWVSKFWFVVEKGGQGSLSCNTMAYVALGSW